MARESIPHFVTRAFYAKNLMNGRPRPLLSTLVTAAAFGAVAGHTLTYMIAVPNPATRRLFLSTTGHGYWPAALPAALVLGVVAAVSTLIRHFGIDDENGSARGWSWGRTVALLGLLQGGIFLTQETIERLAARAPLATLFHDHVLPIGVLVQFGVAAIVAVVLFVLARTAEAVAAALSRRPTHDRAAPSFARRAERALRPRLASSPRAPRAPPALAPSL
jgi:hypothetical protein